MGDTSKHLQGLKNVNDKYVFGRPDEVEYAKIAFDLVAISNGDTEAIKRVSEYIQKQHRRAKSTFELAVYLKSGIVTWLDWAEIWTKGKGE